MSGSTTNGALSLGTLGTALTSALSGNEGTKNGVVDVKVDDNDMSNMFYNTWNGHWLSNNPNAINNSVYSTITNSDVVLKDFKSKMKKFIDKQQNEIKENLEMFATKANEAKTSTEKLSVMQNMQYWLGQKKAWNQLEAYLN